MRAKPINTFVSVSEKNISKPRIAWPGYIESSPSPGRYLHFLAAICEKNAWKSADMTSFVVMRNFFVSGEVDLEVDVTLMQVQTWNYLSPRAFAQEPMPRGSMKEQNMYQQYSAVVYVIRNEEADRDSLPALFRKAARFVKDQKLGFANVESIRYALGYDEEFNMIPELRITVEVDNAEG